MKSSSPPTSHILLHARKLIQQGRRVAALTPSSRALALAECYGIDPRLPQVIVELGAGMGPVTAVAAARMHPESHLIAIEQDPEFAAVARQVAPQAEVIEADVTNLRALLAQRGIDRVDVVLSGLPTPSLPREVVLPVLEWFASLPNDPIFNQITVMPWVYLSMYRRLFRQVEFELVLANLPPGGVYHCRRIKPDFARSL